jgi:hypothetical protein
MVSNYSRLLRHRLTLSAGIGGDFDANNKTYGNAAIIRELRGNTFGEATECVLHQPNTSN